MTNVPDPKRNAGPPAPAPKDSPLELDLPPARNSSPGAPLAGLTSGPGSRGERPRPADGLGAKVAHAVATLARLLVQLSRFGVSKARHHGGKAVSDFNERPEVTRWRAYGFGSYGALVALTFAAQLWEPNSLNAYIKVQPVALPESTVIFVRNDSKTTWKDVKLLLNGLYGYERNDLTPGSHVLLKVDRFAIYNPNGKATYAPKDLPLKTLVIDCDRGHFEQELAK